MARQSKKLLSKICQALTYRRNVDYLTPMEEIFTIRDLIGLWPTRACLAADIQAVAKHLNVTTSRVHKWSEIGAIPAKYHYAVYLAAKVREYDVSAEMLIRLHDPANRTIETAA